MNRRGFMSIMTLGAVSTAAPVLASTPKKESDFDKDGPICTETLSIQSGTKRKPKGEINHLMFDEYEERKKVSMAVGRDGHLWLKADSGEWKRVVTE